MGPGIRAAAWGRLASALRRSGALDLVPFSLAGREVNGVGGPFSIEHDGADRIAIRGELDLATAPELAEVFGGVRGDVLVECQELEFIDTTGLQVIIQAHRRLAEGGHRVVLRGLSRNCRRIFEVAGLDEVLDLDAPSGT